MSDTILLIFEGKKPEYNILDKMKGEFFSEKTILRAIWDCDIVSLYKKIKEDEYLDILPLLQEKSKKENKDIKDLKRDEVSQIYMFFDFEGKILKNKIPEFCDILKEMLEKFNNETGQGKLYISYPMAEALKHAKKDLSINELKCVWDIYEKEHYKTYIGRISDYTDIHKLDIADWELLISLCVQKAYCLVYGKWKIPDYEEVDTLEQSKIFSYQRDRFIIPKNSVVSLSAFPFFILNYFGEKLYKGLKCQNYKKECKFKCIVCQR
ncbi:MAG: hypothetical protein LBQ87_09655 [Candidatus Fibromonas sp.]|jgi:hypothetical protein|nr:hypothetical protein [Candidatus Fibromonas sp.]